MNFPLHIYVTLYMHLLSFQTQQPSVLQFEEISILLSLKDLLFPQFHDPTSLSTLVLLLSDLFPCCDITEILTHERQLREELAAQVLEDREARTSARESRAASAMMVVREDSKLPSEGRYTYTA